MAHFYGEVLGARGKATRIGGKKGISAHIRGWSVGARVEIFHDEKLKKDVVRVYKTSGSNASKSDQLIKEFQE